jgi:hypothetical protein
LIVDERRPERDGPAVLTGGRSEGRKVAGQHLRRRDKRDIADGGLPDQRALVAQKKEELVLPDRAARVPPN